MSGGLSKRGLTVLAAIGLATTVGCREHMPHTLITWPGTGDTIYTHPKPPEGKYYDNWDPWAMTLEVTPVEDVNPVRTQHYLIATVRDKNGKPLPNRRIEWMVSNGGVGEIVEVDESGWRNSRGYKVDNNYAVTHTNNFKHTLDMGDDDPSNDIHLERGQTWCVITSAVEGDTYVTAWCPGIYNTANHKKFVVKHWYDVKWECPPPATNPAGTPHPLTTRVTKYSDGTPLEGYHVTYRITDGMGRFSNGGTSETVYTNASGEATTTISPDGMTGGTANIAIEIMRPANEACCKPPVHIADCTTSKTWVPAEIKITKECPASALSGSTFDYVINVTNPSTVPANNVMVTDALPAGVTFVSSSPTGSGPSWSLGTLQGGASAQIRVTVQASIREGTVQNCASVTAEGGLSDQACCNTAISAPALVVEKTCTPAVMICDPIQYTVIVRNTGSGPASNVVVRDQLPDGLVADDGRTEKVFNAGSLGAGEAKQATYSAKAQRTGTFTNTVTATGDGGLSATTSCTTTVSETALQVTKTATRGEVFIGRNVDFEITVTNTGGAPARDTMLTDTIPSGFTFVSAGQGGSMGGSSVNWNLGTIDPGQSKNVTVTLKCNSATTGTNQACARARCAENCGKADIVGKGIPAVLLEVVDVEDPVEVGSNLTYVITATNQGSVAGTNIVITCDVQPEAEFVSASSQFGLAATQSGKTVTFAPLPSLAPRERAEYRVIVKGMSAGDTRFTVRMTLDQLEGPPVQETESTRFY